MASEISALIDDPELWLPLHTVTDTSEELYECNAELVFNYITIGADFYRRFLRLVRSYPLLYLWLFFARPEVQCKDLVLLVCLPPGETCLVANSWGRSSKLVVTSYLAVGRWCSDQ